MYIVIPEFSIFVVKLRSDVGPEIVTAFARAFDDPSNQTSFDAIVDMRDAKNFEINSSHMQQIGALIKSSRLPDYKAAHIVDTPIQIGMSNMCGRIVECYSVEEVGQFKSIADAAVWLGIPGRTGLPLEDIAEKLDAALRSQSDVTA